jgi:hypothetical protein
MKKMMTKTFLAAASSIFLAAIGCSSKSNFVNPSLGQYGLTVTSVNPTGGVTIGVSPADANGAGTAGSQTQTTGLQLIYKAGTTVTLTAPAATSGPFVAWVGCDSVSGAVCTVHMTGQKSVQVQYTGVSSVTIVPSTLTVAAGSGVQIPAVVNGFGTCTYTITIPGTNPPQTQMVTSPCQGSAVTFAPIPYLATGATGTGTGTVSSTGYYTPASTDPASAVYVQVTSAAAPNVMATVLINLQ